MKRFEDLFHELTVKVREHHPDSGTVREIDAGIDYIGKKIVEEACEVWMAARHEGKEHAAKEISQVLYHVQVMMLALGLSLDDVYHHL